MQTSLGQLESALSAIKEFSERSTEPDDVLVFTIGVGQLYGLVATHNLSACVGSHVMLQSPDPDDLRQITVDVLLGGVRIDYDFSASLVN